MKRIIPFIAAVLVALSAQAQVVNVNLTNGETIKYNAGNVEDITFTERIAIPSAEDPDHFRAVDLGLPSGNLWASHNIGAKKYYEAGYYFAWGEIQPSDTYAWRNYMWGGYDSNNKPYVNKYTNAEGTTTLTAADDAATANWGEEWSMPTKEDFEELIANTTVTAGHDNETHTVLGLTFKAKNASNKAIFIPVAGFYDGEKIYWGEEYLHCNYWTSQLSSADISALLFSCDVSSSGENPETPVISIEKDSRCLGLPIRPVKHKKQ
jgi:hypothetical protein